MKRIIEDFRKDDERILDQLVDGELAEEDRKALLAALDDEPGSWRRCALAFLEAQSWRGDFCAVREATQPQVAPPPVTLAPKAIKKPSRFFEFCLAMAACVVMALGIGVWMRSDGNPPGQPHRIAQDDRSRSTSPAPTVVNWRAKLNYDDPATQGPDNIEVPVREVKGITEADLRESRSALPDELRQALESSGHRVHQRRQLVPIQLEDGRQLVVPVEHVEVDPSKRPAY